jgi:hypothetical protein
VIAIYRVVIRTWKRDGSRDAMSLDAAVENLSRNDSRESGSIEERRVAITHGLLAGVTIETRLASFALQG